MKFSILYPKTKDIVEYTASVLRHIATVNGHEVMPPEDADIICVSVCDVNQINFVERIRKIYPSKIIAVGGHAAIYYKLFGLFCDIINIGQGFEFFECTTLDEIKSLPCVWTKEKDGQVIQSSTKINWKIVPIANVTSNQRYYWGAVGCKNKCKFCLTSWTNPHQKNDSDTIGAVLRKYPNATIVTNDSDEIPSRMTQSIMLLDFLKKPLKKYGVYRIGIEFATDETRRKYGKAFTDDQFRQMIDRAVDEGVRLKLFCIGGINPKQEWRDLFGSIRPIYQKGNFVIKITNVVYDMFTPIGKERMNIDHEKMWRSPEVHKFVTDLKLTGGWGFHSLPCATPEDTMLKNALCFAENIDDYNYVKSLRKQPVDVIQDALVNRLFLNDYSKTVKINHAVSRQN